MPIFVARQWVRHRTARLNEVSGRYSVMKDDFYVPDPQDIAFQSSDNKQGRAVEPAPEAVAERLRHVFQAEQSGSYRSYQELLDLGVARELARANLPISLYTEWYWQMDLHNLFHFLRLRLDPHAQREIRAYAQVIYEITQKVCPLACEAFEEHVNGGVRFSARELAALRDVLAGGENPLTGRRRERFDRKLERSSE
jgi:thymidylate synthase (FAD)